MTIATWRAIAAESPGLLDHANQLAFQQIPAWAAVLGTVLILTAVLRKQADGSDCIRFRLEFEIARNSLGKLS